MKGGKKGEGDELGGGRGQEEGVGGKILERKEDCGETKGTGKTSRKEECGEEGEEGECEVMEGKGGRRKEECREEEGNELGEVEGTG